MSPIIYFHKLYKHLEIICVQHVVFSNQSRMLMRQNVNNKNDISMDPPIIQYICNEGIFSIYTSQHLNTSKSITSSLFTILTPSLQIRVLLHLPGRDASISLNVTECLSIIARVLGIQLLTRPQSGAGNDEEEAEKRENLSSFLLPIIICGWQFSRKSQIQRQAQYSGN